MYLHIFPSIVPATRQMDDRTWNLEGECNRKPVESLWLPYVSACVRMLVQPLVCRVLCTCHKSKTKCDQKKRWFWYYIKYCLCNTLDQNMCNIATEFGNMCNFIIYCIFFYCNVLPDYVKKWPVPTLLRKICYRTIWNVLHCYICKYSFIYFR